MTLSLYEQLALDRERAHQAVLEAERRERELVSLRCALAGLELDLAALKLWRALLRNYRPDQPRVPAGNLGAGQWTDGGGGAGTITDGDVDASGRTEGARVILAGGFTKDDLNVTVESFVAQNCRGRIRRELPGQFLGLTISEVAAAAKSGDSGARTCLKLLREDRFRK